MAFVFPPPPDVSLGINGTEERFPVHRIYCVGRNYAAHAVEMGHDPDKEPPFFFQKNPDNLVPAGVDFPYPDRTNDLHHEIELVVALSGGGKDIPVDEALGCVYGYAVGLDMTRRDLQGQMKKAGRPWEIGKAFEHSAPCSDIVPAEQIGHPQSGRVWLEVNGEPRQEGDLNQLIWKNAETIAYLSGLFELQAGDLIFTGTPSGVAAVEKGDQLFGGVEGVGELSVMVI
jgi:fumarylpyruvate hydrolase